MSGNAYFTRLFSRVVGPSGRVYAFIPTEEIKNCPATEVAGSRAVSRDPMYTNVKLLTGPVNQFSVPEPLDILWTAQNYHDLHDKFMGPADVRQVNRAFFNALKAGGALIVVDHVAAPGSSLATTESLHRIDPAIMRRRSRLRDLSLTPRAMSWRIQTMIIRDPHSIRAFAAQRIRWCSSFTSRNDA